MKITPEKASKPASQNLLHDCKKPEAKSFIEGEVEDPGECHEVSDSLAKLTQAAKAFIDATLSYFVVSISRCDCLNSNV